MAVHRVIPARLQRAAQLAWAAGGHRRYACHGWNTSSTGASNPRPRRDQGCWRHPCGRRHDIGGWHVCNRRHSCGGRHDIGGWHVCNWRHSCGRGHPCGRGHNVDGRRNVGGRHQDHRWDRAAVAPLAAGGGSSQCPEWHSESDNRCQRWQRSVHDRASCHQFRSAAAAPRPPRSISSRARTQEQISIARSDPLVPRGARCNNRLLTYFAGTKRRQAGRSTDCQVPPFQRMTFRRSISRFRTAPRSMVQSGTGNNAQAIALEVYGKPPAVRELPLHKLPRHDCTPRPEPSTSRIVTYRATPTTSSVRQRPCLTTAPCTTRRKGRRSPHLEPTPPRPTLRLLGRFADGCFQRPARARFTWVDLGVLTRQLRIST